MNAIMLWVTDVLEDPYDPEKAIVRIYNEVDDVKHPKVGVVAQGQKPEKPIYKKNTLVYHANE
ncbi:hypothetical protein ACT691_14775 [Vibrio metschnikovii]